MIFAIFYNISLVIFALHIYYLPFIKAYDKLSTNSSSFDRFRPVMASSEVRQVRIYIYIYIDRKNHIYI